MIPKYRAYLVTQKKMVDVVTINFDEQIILYHSGEKCWHGLDLETEAFEKIYLLQSTGTHNKNGVEIFAGDIVVLSRGVGVVETKIGHAPQVTYKNGNDLLRFVFDNLSVIGNIYANPELLEQQNG